MSQNLGQSEQDNWEFISYDSDGGYEVNAAYTTGRIYEIDDDSDTGIIRFLHRAGFVDDTINDLDIDIDGDENVIYVNYQGYPICEFRRTNKPTTYTSIQ